MPFTFSAVAGPMVSPLNVRVTEVLLGMEDNNVSVSTIDVELGNALDAVTALPLNVASGTADVAKKPMGKLIVIWSAGLADAANAPSELVANEIVALHDVFPATRSVNAMENKGFATAVLVVPSANCSISTHAQSRSNCPIVV